MELMLRALRLIQTEGNFVKAEDRRYCRSAREICRLAS